MADILDVENSDRRSGPRSNTLGAAQQKVFSTLFGR